MPLFYAKYDILPEHRGNCMTFFAMMNDEMDKADAGPCKLLGRWATTGEASGFFVAEAPDATAMGNWLYNWITMATCKVWPICDDNTAREIILKTEPSWKAKYDKVGDEAPDGYSLYSIEFKFDFTTRGAGYAAFANMSEEQDAADAGACINMGRWHNLGMGSGFGVCAAKSEADLYAWAFNWNSMCDCEIKPVMSDKEVRGMIAAKPDFGVKVTKVKAAMGMP